MISITLPYSKKIHKVKKIAFEQVMDISYILSDGKDSDLIDYLEAFFNIESLSVVDKFYIILKAREMFINDTISVTAGNNTHTKINLSILLDNLTDLPNFATTIDCNGITFDLDIPNKFVIGNNNLEYCDNVIKSIKIRDIEVKYNLLPDNEKNNILEQLPPSIFRYIKEYLRSLDLTLVLFNGRQSLNLDPIVVNFISQDPVLIIKALYSEYDVNACRDIVFYLSQKIGESILLRSTMLDITGFINEISSRNQQSRGSNPVLSV